MQQFVSDTSTQIYLKRVKITFVGISAKCYITRAWLFNATTIAISLLC